MDPQQEGIAYVVYGQQEAELTVVQWFEGDPQPTDVPRLRGLVSRPAANSGG